MQLDNFLENQLRDILKNNTSDWYAQICAYGLDKIVAIPIHLDDMCQSRHMLIYSHELGRLVNSWEDICFDDNLALCYYLGIGKSYIFEFDDPITATEVLRIVRKM